MIFLFIHILFGDQLTAGIQIIFHRIAFNCFYCLFHPQISDIKWFLDHDPLKDSGFQKLDLLHGVVKSNNLNLIFHSHFFDAAGSADC